MKKSNKQSTNKLDITQEQAESLMDGFTEEWRKVIRDVLEKKMWEKVEFPIKALEQERKTAAIAELERLEMNTKENVAKINAIKFLEDGILIDKTKWTYKNMEWGQWVFRRETNRQYYNFTERKAEAKKQWIVLPTIKDFQDTLKALPGDYSLDSWYKWWNILSIILWESKTGCCVSGGDLINYGERGYLGSVSECNVGMVDIRHFIFNKSEGGLYYHNKDIRSVCRPLVKNS